MRDNEKGKLIDNEVEEKHAILLHGTHFYPTIQTTHLHSIGKTDAASIFVHLS